MAQIESLENKESEEEQNTVNPSPKKRKRVSIQPKAKPKEAEEERLTVEEWEERLKAEEEAKPAKSEQPKTPAEEQKLKETTNPTAQPGQPKRKMGLIETLQANMDEALGIVPNPATNVAASRTQQYPEASNLQEIGREGIFSSMRENPIVSGIVAMTGLILMLIGTFSRVLEVAFIIEIIGLAISAFGIAFIIRYLLRK
ncbi:MAG: hypothetical protein QXP36_11315 [Conexivisphaerales archaeon]